jgi:hypothetical protein
VVLVAIAIPPEMLELLPREQKAYHLGVSVRECVTDTARFNPTPALRIWRRMTPEPEQIGSGCCGVRRAGRITSFASECETRLKAAAAE